MLLLLQDKLYDSQRFHIPARRIVNRAPDKEAAPSDYFKITFRKFFFPFFRTSPSPESFSFPNTAWMSDTFSPSTATPPCCTARLASALDGTRPLFNSMERMSMPPSVRSSSVSSAVGISAAFPWLNSALALSWARFASSSP